MKYLDDLEAILEMLARGAMLGSFVGALTGAILGIRILVIGAIYGIPIGAIVGICVGALNGTLLGTVTMFFFRTLMDERSVTRYRIISRIVGALGSGIFTYYAGLMLVSPDANDSVLLYYAHIPATLSVLFSQWIVPKVIKPYIDSKIILESS